MRFFSSIFFVLSLVTPGLSGQTVTTVDDELDPIAADGDGISLREAIRDATAGATITFDPALSGQTITLGKNLGIGINGSGEIVIDKDILIDASSLANKITIDANGAVTNHRVLSVDSTSIVDLHHLIITGGKTPDGPLTGQASGGGGIFNEGTLTLSHCIISNNSTGDGGGCVFGSGGRGG